MDIELLCKPLTAELWPDFEALFGERGACGGCWCMWFRLKRSEFEMQKGEPNKSEMHKLVAAGEVPGILVYAQDCVVGWCSLGPREAFPVLQRSRILKPVDDEPVWAIVCFFVRKEFRRQGVSKALLQAAIEYARSRGAKLVEGYPVAPKKDTYPDLFGYTGFFTAFEDVGFREVERRSPTRPIMRYDL